jgi:hypothetical protein
MKKKITEFVKYHNAFVIMMVLALVGVGSVFANEDVRDAVIGEEVVVETKGLDNSIILAADLENFDAMMQIIGVTEDAENYFVEYAYQTLAIQDNAWAEFTRQEVLSISKAALMSRDLGLYLIEELGEIVENELALLKEVQEEELAKGKTEIVETIDYTGLIGLVLDVKNKILPGYEPKVFGCMDSTANNYNPDATQNDESCDYSILGCTDPQALNYSVSAEKDDGSCQHSPVAVFGCMDSTATNYNPSATENNGSCVYPPPPAPTPPAPLAPPASLTPIYGCMDSTAMNYNPDATENDGSCEYPAPPADEPADVCDAEHLDLCNTQELCQGISLYWYDEVCNTSAEEPADEPPADVCGAEHLELCNTQELCEGISLYWYDDTCNTSAEEPADEPPADEPSADVCGAEHIDLCGTQELCETVGLYWYNDVCNPEAQIILGCTDETAINYNAEAAQDDGSCEYPPEPVLGCMDSSALNYNSEATEDDGTCEYPTPTCESFTYSDWSECQAGGTQTRTILTSSPDACENGEPVLSQTCDYEQ